MGIEIHSAKDERNAYEQKMFRISIVNNVNLLSFPIRKEEVECE